MNKKVIIGGVAAVAVVALAGFFFSGKKERKVRDGKSKNANEKRQFESIMILFFSLFGMQSEYLRISKLLIL